MADDEDVDATAALLGVPTGEETLSRHDVDNLEVSARQQRRPEGVSRAEYMRSGPGHETQMDITVAGVYRRRNLAIALTVTLTLAGVGALIWYLVLNG